MQKYTVKNLPVTVHIVDDKDKIIYGKTVKNADRKQLLDEMRYIAEYLNEESARGNADAEDEIKTAVEAYEGGAR